MFDQLTELVKQYGGDAIVNNPAVPNEQNEAVIKETSRSIFSGLKEMASENNLDDLAGILSGKVPIDVNNSVVKNLSSKVSEHLEEKYYLSPQNASGITDNLLPQVLGGLIGNAQDPNQPEFNVQDIISSISDGQGGGLMDLVSKYGGKLGLDQDGDGQVGMSDAVAAVTKKSGGLGGLLGKLFGK